MGGGHADPALFALADAVQNLPQGPQLLPLFKDAARAESDGRMKDACNHVTIAGINILRMGPEHCQLAERVFQHAVFLAKKWDDNLSPPAVALLESQNVKLADAYNWLANAENTLGKSTEAEGHQQSALNAVRDLAILETSLRSLHYSRQLRAASSFPKFKIFLKKWTAKVVAAAEEGLDCPLDLLESAAAVLQERSQAYVSRGKLAKAALLHAGPLLAVTARVEGIPTRWEPPTLSEYEPMFPMDDLKTDRWKPSADAGASASSSGAGAVAGKSGTGASTPEALRARIYIPDNIYAQLMERAGAVIACGDSWELKGGPVEGMAQYNDLGQRLLNLSNLLYSGKRWGEAARLARSASRLLAGQGPQQGAALHLLGASSFHQGQKTFSVARRAFEASAKVKEADLAARAERAEALHPDEHVQYVETLLFLGHVLWETQAVDEAERVHGKALGVARERLGDHHPVLKKALEAMINLKQKVAALQRMR